MVLYRVIWFLAGLLFGGVAVQYKNRKEFFREKKRKYHMSLLENSITDLNRKDLMPYFTDHGYKSIIVYGMGYYYPDRHFYQHNIHSVDLCRSYP